MENDMADLENLTAEDLTLEEIKKLHPKILRIK